MNIVVLARAVSRVLSLLVVFPLGLYSPASARPGSAFESPRAVDPADTATVSYTLGEVVVTATRNEAVLRALPSAVNPVVRELISLKPGSLVSSALAGLPGVFIRPYGGAASVQTISLRGMSAENTLVLVDGQRYNSYQNGQTDFGILTSANVERVEVVKGGYSSLYGADAVGGVVNIITRKPTSETNFQFNSSIGSNGFSAAEFSATGKAADLGWRGMIRQERGRGDYEFLFDDGSASSRLRRSGSDFRSLVVDGRLEYSFSEKLDAFIAATWTDADRGTPGPMTDPGSSGSARLADKIFRSNAGARWKLSDQISARVNASLSMAEEDYGDPKVLISGRSLRSSSTNRSMVVSPEMQFALSPAFSGTVGIESGRASIRGNEVTDAFRWQRSAFLSTQHSFKLPTSVPFEFTIFPALRYDSFSGIDGDVSPRIGINVGILQNPDLRIRSSYGKSFRVPTFNDLYWIAGGNPSLRPERSLSFDAGAIGSLEWLGRWDVEVTTFAIDSHDRIVWTPTGGSFWSPKNISRTESRGVEAEVRWTGFDEAVTLTLNSTWTDVLKKSEDFPGDPTSGKQLIYSPRQTVNASAAFVWGNAGIFVQHSWTSFRYTTEINDRFLPSYAVTSAAVQYLLMLQPVKISAKLEATNIFNTSYQIVALYPVPLRQFRATLGAEL
jgi:outer membrane cobalamin receptor